MPSLNLSVTEKHDVQKFVENVQRGHRRDLDGFSMTFAQGNEAAWYRFIKGTYNHPITWWIGIFQLQMQMGMWGSHHRAVASTRASVLWQISRPLRDEVVGMVHGEPVPLLSAIVRYNLKHRKADIIGRFLGGAFTNYASMGGRLGQKHLPKTAKHIGTVTNLGIASYGAAIKAVGGGPRTLEAVVQSVLTGSPEHLPPSYRNDIGAPLGKSEGEVLQNLQSALSEVMSLSQAAPGPVPIAEFCSRPENVNLKGVCR